MSLVDSVPTVVPIGDPSMTELGASAMSVGALPVGCTPLPARLMNGIPPGAAETASVVIALPIAAGVNDTSTRHEPPDASTCPVQPSAVIENSAPPASAAVIVPEVGDPGAFTTRNVSAPGVVATGTEPK